MPASNDHEPRQPLSGAPSEPLTEEDTSPREPWEGLPPLPEDPDLLALREQLFRREIALINKMKFMLEHGQVDARQFSKVVIEAIALQSGSDSRLAAALDPLVQAIVTRSMSSNRDEFINALFPIIGPSIRKSIAENFRSMLGSFSKSLEMSLSWRGLRWRLEALRSGKPFSEIVLLHTLVYRIEQIFFIHSETGLVLSHMVNEGVGSQDADMVSAMLTAIQDFVRDCFASGHEGELESLQLGEFTILIEKSRQAYLACVVRGTPPADFKGRLRDALDALLVEYSDKLAAFKGDSGPFEHSARHLQDLMSSRYADENDSLPLWAKITPLALILTLVIGFGWYRFQSWSHTREMEAALSILRQEPGLLVMNVEEKGFKPWQVLTLQDNLARNPEEVLESVGLEGNFKFQLVPYVSYDPAIIERRIRNNLDIPAEVQMQVEQGVLTLSGKAPMEWIMEARERAHGLPGVKRVDTEELIDPRMTEIASMIKLVEDTVIEFPSGRDLPVSADMDKFAKAVDTLVELEQLARKMGLAVTLTIYGHADSTGSDKTNYEISLARARTLAAMLYAKGSGIPVSMYGMGSEYAREQGNGAMADQASRRIEMRVHLMQTPSLPLALP